MGMKSIEIPLLFVGGGTMAHAIITGAQKSGVLSGDRVGVLDPSGDRRGMFDQGFESAQGAFEWLRGVEKDGYGVVLAVKPQMMGAATESLRLFVEQSGVSPVVISILAGTRSGQVFEAFGGGVRVVRVMPNTPAQIGMGMAAIAGSESSSDSDIELAERLMGAVGETVPIDESMMDAFTAVAGSGPAYVFYLAEAMTKAAVSLGFDAGLARRIVEQTVVGSAGLLGESDDDAAALRGRVTSKNGTTHAATTALDGLGVMEAFAEALTAARDRGIELSEEG